MNSTKRNLEVSIIALLVTLFAALIVDAHGEDHPGPHGGSIQMPGAYHTEVLAKANGFQVYLLDMNFENPSVKDSQVMATLVSSDQKHKLTCEKQTNHYFCSANKLPKKGQLILNTTRENSKGNEAIYQLPL